MKTLRAGFDYNFGFEFFGTMERIFKRDRSVRAIDTLNRKDYAGATEKQRMVRYTTNHDVNSSDGTPLELFGGEKGSMAAFVVAAYMKSVPMIYTGQEVGTPDRMVFPFTAKNIDWSIHPEVTAEYKKVIDFRNLSKAIRRGELTSYSTDDVCAFTKKVTGEEVLVLSNLRNKEVDFTLPAATTGNWIDAMHGGLVTLAGTVHIPAYSYLVYKR